MLIKTVWWMQKLKCMGWVGGEEEEGLDMACRDTVALSLQPSIHNLARQLHDTSDRAGRAQLESFRIAMAY